MCIGAALSACEGGGRFPVCRTNADCGGEDGGGEDGGASGAVCFNLRCVECRYDVDCPPGKACSGSNECVSLSTRAPESADAGAVKWEPASWRECAADCKDEACLKKCSERFER